MTQTPFFFQLPTDEALERIAERVAQKINLGLQPQQPQTNSEAEAPISIDEACALLRISRVTLYNWRQQGLIAVHGVGRRKYLYKSELMESLKQPKRFGSRSICGRNRRNAKADE
jgi:excisionase family DNA binding protein